MALKNVTGRTACPAVLDVKNTQGGSPPEQQRGVVMIVAVPTKEERLDQHFGHCAAFSFLTVDSAQGTIVNEELQPAPEHEHGLLPRWLKERHVALVITGGLGAHARALLEKQQIEIVSGAPSDRPRELVRRYLAGELASVEKSCACNCKH